MAWWSRLFGASTANGADASPKETRAAEVYKDFRIVVDPQKTGSSYRIGAVISGEVDGEAREHILIRADTIQDFEEACRISLMKAKQVIDEQGARLFR